MASFHYVLGIQGFANENSGMALLRELGFEYATTTEVSPVEAHHGPFLIPRFNTNHIRDYLRTAA